MKRTDMKPEQARYLRGRLNTIRQSKPGRYELVKVPTPAQVKAALAQIAKASRVTQAWSKKCERAKESRNKRVSKAYDLCMRAILFGDAKAAIRALDRFEAMKF